ncbi:MAG: preprotein translocase subunit SecY, partial [Erysipelotrichaceae bacterium]|nr:preprotein translocase subunit SecY [Erysipelotrichaceae bacterium]
MIKNLISMFKHKDIRKKILFTVAMLFIFRLGAGIPLPGVDTEALLAGVTDNSIIGMMNLLGGGALERFSIFALGVGPYITSSIIIQLLAMDVIPALTEMSKNGQQGRQQMDKITRYLAVVLAFLQAYTMTYAFHVNYGILSNPTVSTYLFMATVLTAGTSFLVWLGDRITQFGIGNGISILIFAGIVADLPFSFANAFKTLVDTTSGGSAAFSGVVSFAILLLMYIAIIVAIIFMNEATRKIPIQ